MNGQEPPVLSVFGDGCADELARALIDEVNASRNEPGNARVTEAELKTRVFHAILRELVHDGCEASAWIADVRSEQVEAVAALLRYQFYTVSITVNHMIVRW